jgi:hypothetical protein
MADPVDDLILDLLAWLDETPRTYAEVIDAWRTSCPRLPVWEEANDRGFITRDAGPNGAVISVSARGAAHLVMCGRSSGHWPERPMSSGSAKA